MRAQEWDERYAERQQWSAEPNALIADLLSGLPPGDAVDLAAGEGRHALWLAGLGWRVTAVDFSDVGLARGRGQSGADRVTWVTADVTTWTAEPDSLDLVLVAYLHLPEADTTALFSRAVGWLRPGGRLLVSGMTWRTSPLGWAAPRRRTSCTASTGWRRSRRCSTSTGWSRCGGRRRPARRSTPCCGAADLPLTARYGGSLPP